jgi:hypothetical protein
VTRKKIAHAAGIATVVVTMAIVWLLLRFLNWLYWYTNVHDGGG